MVRAYQTKLPWLLSLLGHALLLGVMLLTRGTGSMQVPEVIMAAPMQESVVHSSLLDEAMVAQEVARLEQLETDKIKREKAELKRVRDEAQKAREQKRQAEKARAELEARQASEAKKKQQETQQAQKQLQELQAQQAQEQKKLEQLLAQQKQAQDEAQQARRQQAELARRTEIERYSAMLRQQVMRHWLVAGNVSDNIRTQLVVRLDPAGAVLSVRVESSSGDEVFDRSAVNAVYRAAPLPVPSDAALFEQFRELRLTLRPEEIVNAG